MFPDYELTDHPGTRRRLSDLQGNDPMVLVLARGHFCPKDHQQHLELAALYPRIAVAYTQIVTISTDNILETNEFRSSVGARWTFLSDADRKVQKDLREAWEAGEADVGDWRPESLGSNGFDCFGACRSDRLRAHSDKKLLIWT